MKIFVDLDSVLVNFQKGCEQIFDWPHHKTQSPDEDIPTFLNITIQEFWNIIDSKGEEWWANLEPEEWADELIDIVSKYDPNFVMPLHEGAVCKGYDLRQIPTDSLFEKGRINLNWLLDFYCEYPDKENFFRKNKYFDLLAGTPHLRELIEKGSAEETIRASWADGLAFFRLVRKDYLLYDE